MGLSEHMAPKTPGVKHHFPPTNSHLLDCIQLFSKPSRVLVMPLQLHLPGRAVACLAPIALQEFGRQILGVKLGNCIAPSNGMIQHDPQPGLLSGMDKNVGFTMVYHFFEPDLWDVDHVFWSWGATNSLEILQIFMLLGWWGNELGTLNAGLDPSIPHLHHVPLLCHLISLDIACVDDMQISQKNAGEYSMWIQHPKNGHVKSCAAIVLNAILMIHLSVWSSPSSAKKCELAPRHPSFCMHGGGGDAASLPFTFAFPDLENRIIDLIWTGWWFPLFFVGNMAAAPKRSKT